MTGLEIAGMEENMRGGSGFFTDAKNATGFCPEKRKILRKCQVPIQGRAKSQLMFAKEHLVLVTWLLALLPYRKNSVIPS